MFNGFRSLWKNIRSFFVRKANIPLSGSGITFQPYKDMTANIEYNKLFCDNLALFRPAGKLGGIWKKIFSGDSFIEDLKSISENDKIETRTRILVFKELRVRGVANAREVLGTVIEVGAEEGVDAIGIYNDLTAVYINAGGRLFSANNTEAGSIINETIKYILDLSQNIIGKAERSTEPRHAPPSTEQFRISFLAADGVYVGEGKLANIDADPVAKALIFGAGKIMIALANPSKEAASEVPGAIANTPVK